MRIFSKFIHIERFENYFNGLDKYKDKSISFFNDYIPTLFGTFNECIEYINFFDQSTNNESANDQEQDDITHHITKSFFGE